ncbi:uncharacterized protein C1orf112-like isoform X2 [Anneissia japonica]|uniref:uncharacterized protein C1orf112-like isoform X2 n=1 Tax=Anneissia japonica TaxID=1529436 RepID=UPI001425B526|nr:uncharacterized protein C1orf112-like isoform X2 [Anneissia japonica]
MSQSTLLQEVQTWDEKRCKEGVDDALPHLICDFTNGTMSDQRLTILRALASSFLPVINISEFQDKVFAKVLPTVLMDIVDNMVLFVSCASKSSEVRFGYIASLPPSAVHVVKGSFEHCKESNTLYGDLFQDVSEHLMHLFKKAHQLQKALMSLMDLLPLTSDTPDECIEGFVQVCCAFHDVCCIIGKMDSALMVATWKFLVKLITKRKEYMQYKLDVSAMVSSLCSDIQNHFESCLDQAPSSNPSHPSGDEKAFQRTLKICHLSAKMLVHLLKEYRQLAMLKPMTLYEMILTFYSKSSPSLDAPDLAKQSHEGLKNSLLVCIEPILQLICNEARFCEVVTKCDNKVSDNHDFAQCMLLSAVMKQLPSCDDEAQAMWLAPQHLPHDEPRVNILEAMFSSISECYPELTLPVELPGEKCDGKPPENVSFHQYLVTHISAYIASVQAKHFYLVESALLKWCLSPHTHVALVAMDVWCFLARYSSAEVCNNHVRRLLEVLNQVPAGHHSTQHTHLSLLVGRLIGFMTAGHQFQLVSEFPPSEYPNIWSCLPLLAFDENTQKTICDDIISKANQGISHWLSTEPKTLTNVYNLCCHVAVLSNVYQNYEQSQPPISKQQHSSVIQTVEQLWSSLNIECIKDHVILILLLHISSCLLNNLKNQTLIKVMEQLSSAVCAGAGADTRLAISAFLGSMGKLTLTNDEQVDHVLSRIANMFSLFLSDQCYVVHQHAVVVFSEFAEETAYESIVTDSLADESIQANVVQFLHQIPYAVTDNQQTEIANLKLQKDIIKEKQLNSHLHNVAKRKDIGDTIKTTENDEIIEPAPKRCKGEQDVDSLRSVVTQLEAFVAKVQVLKQDIGSLPNWFKQDVMDIGKQLMDICG